MDGVKNVGWRIFTNSWETQMGGQGSALVRGEGWEGIPTSRENSRKYPHQDQHSPHWWKFRGYHWKKSDKKKTEEKISRTYTSDQEKSWEKSQMFKNYLKLIPS